MSEIDDLLARSRALSFSAKRDARLSMALALLAIAVNVYGALA